MRVYVLCVCVCVCVLCVARVLSKDDVKLRPRPLSSSSSHCVQRREAGSSQLEQWLATKRSSLQLERKRHRLQQQRSVELVRPGDDST